MPKKLRVITFDSERAKMWREAWDLLLTDRYNLMQICQILHDRGYTRKSGKPWVWINAETGETECAESHLSRTFNNPFYAGWVISKAYNLKRGDKRGIWPAIVSDEEFDEGVAILDKRDQNRNRVVRFTYPLSGLLYMRIDE
jgi:hypothetical protein